MVNIFGKKQKGFTLIELVIVVLIVGIIVLLATPKFIGYTQEAKLTQIKNDTKTVEAIISEHLIKNKDLPEDLDEFDYSTALNEGKIYNKNGLITNLEGSYIDITNMEEIKAINSKLKGNFIANNTGDVYYVAVERVVVEAEKNELDKLLEKYPKLATYNNLYFVDKNSTNNEVDGSFDNPYKTLQEALAVAKSGDAIYLKAGEYNLNSFLELFNANNVEYWGEGKSTIISINKMDLVTKNVTNKFYRLTFKPSQTMSTSSYGLFMGNPEKQITYNLEFYNCLFIDPHKIIAKNVRHRTYLIGDSSRYIEHKYQTFNLINCVAIDHPLVSVWSDYYESRVLPNIKIINSATTEPKIDCPNTECGTGYAHDPLKKITSLENVTFDENYNITSGTWQNAGTGLNRDGTQAHIGLYGGEYAWE